MFPPLCTLSLAAVWPSTPLWGVCVLVGRVAMVWRECAMVCVVDHVSGPIFGGRLGGSAGDGIMCCIGAVCGQVCVIWVFGDPVLAGRGSWGRVGCSESVSRAGPYCHFLVDLNFVTATTPDHRGRPQAPVCMFMPLHTLSRAAMGTPVSLWGVCVSVGRVAMLWRECGMVCVCG